MLRSLRHKDGGCRGGGGYALNDAKRAVVARVDVFPMRLQRRVASSLAALLDAKSNPERELDILPTNYTHSLSVVQLYDFDSGSSLIARANDVEDEKMGVRGTFLVGLAPLKLLVPTIYPVSSCRPMTTMSSAGHMGNWPRSSRGTGVDSTAAATTMAVSLSSLFPGIRPRGPD